VTRSLKTFAAACSLLVVLTACPKRAPLPGTEGLTPETARARLEREGMRRERMGGHLKARMDGISGLLASADLAVVVEAPASLHIAVRSFFEQPMLVLATDGVHLAILDATQDSGVTFRRGIVDGKSFSTLLPFDVWPQELVALLLGVAPAAGALPRQLGIDEAAGTYSVGLLEPGGRVSVVEARASDDALVRWRRFGKGGKPLFDARYEDIRATGDVGFAHRLRLKTPAPDGGEHALRFEAVEIEVNGEPYDPRAFDLTPPPGVRVLPLSAGVPAAAPAAAPATPEAPAGTPPPVPEKPAEQPPEPTSPPG
jgi:hypothetical protein